MRFLTDLQHRFGFTENEIRVILFLTVALLAGVGIRWLRSDGGAPGGIRPVFDYSRSDSEFIALSRAVIGDTAAADAPPLRSPRGKQPQLTAGGININTATKQQLVLLPGIGDSYAERIILYRDENGSFTTVDGLLNVKGIGPKKLEKMRRFITPLPH